MPTLAHLAIFLLSHGYVCLATIVIFGLLVILLLRELRAFLPLELKVGEPKKGSDGRRRK